MECRRGLAMRIPSVRPSEAWIVTKWQKDMFIFLYDTKDNVSFYPRSTQPFILPGSIYRWFVLGGAIWWMPTRLRPRWTPEPPPPSRRRQSYSYRLESVILQWRRRLWENYSEWAITILNKICISVIAKWQNKTCCWFHSFTLFTGTTLS